MLRPASTADSRTAILSSQNQLAKARIMMRVISTVFTKLDKSAHINQDKKGIQPFVGERMLVLAAGESV